MSLLHRDISGWLVMDGRWRRRREARFYAGLLASLRAVAADLGVFLP